MLNAIEISPAPRGVGGIDWDERLFHGYTAEAGKDLVRNVEASAQKRCTFLRFSPILL